MVLQKAALLRSFAIGTPSSKKGTGNFYLLSATGLWNEVIINSLLSSGAEDFLSRIGKVKITCPNP